MIPIFAKMIPRQQWIAIWSQIRRCKVCFEGNLVGMPCNGCKNIADYRARQELLANPKATAMV